MIANILSIAGSDPSGGAGIQADLKTFSALGCYGMAAITALTAQNTKGVTAVHELPAEFVGAQLEAIFTDIRVDAVKIGMAGSPETISAIADILKKYQPKYIVLDPVMVAQSGDLLLSDAAVKTLKEHLIPLATIVTPNIPEAMVLLGKKNEMNAQILAENLLKKFPCPAFLVKGGHDNGKTSDDVFVSVNDTKRLSTPRIDTKNNHGTGCTLSSAIAAHLGKGMSLPEAVEKSKNYITHALQNTSVLDVGHGAGPVHHFHAIWKNHE